MRAGAAENETPTGAPSPRPPRSTVFLGTGGQFLLDESSVNIARFGQRTVLGPTTLGWAVSAGVRSPQFGPLVCCDAGGSIDFAWPLLRTGPVRLGPYVGGVYLTGFSEGKTIGKGFVAGPSAGVQLGLLPHSPNSDLSHTTLTVGYVRWFGRNLEPAGESGLMLTLEAAMGFF